MKSFLSQRAKNTGRSAIREVLKYTKKPEVISFAGGLPKPDTFPRRGLAESAASQIRDNYENSLQYGTTEGVEEFRLEMSSWLTEFGLELELENIISTNSSQQALDLVCKAFLDPDDLVFCGLPTYLGAVQAFSAFQAKKVGVPLEEDGLDLETLENKIKEAQSAGETLKFIYVVPDFQNPTGVTLSEQKRKKILGIAEEYDLLIIEDTPYFGVRFSGDFKRPIGSYDESGRVITIASLSKILSSGMRLAVATGPSDLLAELVTMKQSTDLCTSTTTQWIAADWLANNNLSDHLQEIRKYYKENRDAMLEAIKNSFPRGKKVSWTEPNGGLFIWVTLPEEVDAETVFKKGLKHKVAFVPGHHFYVDDSGQNTMRLSYSLLTPEKIKEGIARLGKVLKKELNPVSQ
ncbi:MAG: PLP-dependent aminotransferase family protein [Candidatus Bipolaricaulia bacterium]